MKKIDISINQAKILSFRVELNEDSPKVSSCIGLFAGNQKISEFYIATDSWEDAKKFELPASMIKPILKIAKDLEHITALKCSAAIGQLTEGK